MDRFHNCNGTARTLDRNGNKGATAHPGFFGTDGRLSFENESQIFKVPHLRNAYQKLGMYGTSLDEVHAVGSILPPLNPPVSAVRGFGYQHDGATGTVEMFFTALPSSCRRPFRSPSPASTSRRTRTASRSSPTRAIPSTTRKASRRPASRSVRSSPRTCSPSTRTSSRSWASSSRSRRVTPRRTRPRLALLEGAGLRRRRRPRRARPPLRTRRGLHVLERRLRPRRLVEPFPHERAARGAGIRRRV